MKRKVSSLASVLCLALLSLSAQAHNFTLVTAVPDCDTRPDPYITLTFAGDNMEPIGGATAYAVEWVINFLPNDGGDPIESIGSGSEFFEGVITQYDSRDRGFFSVDFDVPVPDLDDRNVSLSGQARLYQATPDLPPTDDAPYGPLWDIVYLNGGAAVEANCKPTLASLGDRVWNDLDRDGVQDGNPGDLNFEPGIAGVTVNLTDCNSKVIDTDTTDSLGEYLFDNLDAGKYCVVFDKTTVNLGCDEKFSSPGAGIDGTVDSDVIDLITGKTLPVTLGSGDANRDVDAGLYCPEPEKVSLGDYVWEDLNGNGIQDDGEPGVPNVDVYLYTDCEIDTPTLVQGPIITDSDGSYLFENLPAGDYCVAFDLDSAKPALNNCDVYFTKPNQTAVGTEATDSDANTTTGRTDSVTLAAGGQNLDLDAGLVCPAVIGDYVWLDADNLGISDDAGDVPFTAADVTVILRSCAEPNEPVATTTTDGGFYQFVSGPSGTDGFDLSADPNGCFYVQFDEPDGYDFTVLDEGNVANDSNCSADPSTDGNVTIVSGTDNQTLDCGLVPEPLGCGLDLTKRCYVQPPIEVPFTGDCKGKLQQFTVIWNGADGVSVADDVRNDSDGDISNGEAVTFFAPDGGFSDNDVFVTIVDVGQSVFHMSCSDDLFDGPEDCGLPAGNGKGDDDADGLNSWLFGGFVDAEGKTLVCPALMAPSEVPDSAFAAECPFTAPIPPSCDTIDKPELLTWRYDGGSCADSTFAGLQGDDFLCEEGVDLDPTAAIAVYDDQDGDNVVMPGKEFTISRDASKKLLLQQNSADVQYLEAHMSCSQPIAVGATAGALTLVALDGQRGDVDVLYRFDVKNTGDSANNVWFTDPLLGFETNLGDLDTGYSDSFDLIASISGTTENTARIEGLSVFGDECSDSATATAEAIIPPCNIGIYIDDVADDALKLKLTNNDSRNRIATLEEVVITYPAHRGAIKEVKLDGAIYKSDDNDGPDLVSTATIGLDDWTEGDVTKRQLDPGEERTLEIKTFEQTEKEDAVFTVTLKFGDCEYTFDVDYSDKKTTVTF